MTPPEDPTLSSQLRAVGVATDAIDAAQRAVCDALVGPGVPVDGLTTTAVRKTLLELFWLSYRSGFERARTELAMRGSTPTPTPPPKDSPT